MGTGLTFDEYIERTAMPMAGADPVFVQAVEEEREQMFPMKLVLAANHLRSRCYDCRPASLELLSRALRIEVNPTARLGGRLAFRAACFARIEKLSCPISQILKIRFSQ